MGRKYAKKSTKNKINSYDLFNRKKSSNFSSDIDLGCINKKKLKKSDKQKFSQEPSRSFKSFMKFIEHQSSSFEGLNNDDESRTPGKQKNKYAGKEKLEASETHGSFSQSPSIAKQVKVSKRNLEDSQNVKAPILKQKKQLEASKEGQTSGRTKLPKHHEKEVGGIFKKKLTKHEKRREETRNQEREARRLKMEDKKKDLQEKKYFTDRISLHERVDCPPVLRTPLEKIKTKSKLDARQKSVEKPDSLSAKISNWGKQKKQLGVGNNLTPVKPKSSELNDQQLQLERERVMEQYRLIKLNKLKPKNKLTPVEI